jgi:hypothetical protein
MYEILFEQSGLESDLVEVLERLPAMRSAIDAGLGYARRHVLPGGRVQYQVLYPSGEPGRGYNLMRHAGLIAELCRARLMGIDPADTRPQVQALACWLDRHVVAVGEGESICSDAPVDGLLKLGQSGLGTVAMAAVHRCGPGIADADGRRERIRRLANHLLRMHRPDGSVPCKYWLETGAVAPFESQYYPSQTVMALVAAYEMFREPAYLDGAARALRNVVARELPGVTFERFNHHWMVLALAALDRLQPEAEWAQHLGHLVAWLAAHPVAHGDHRALGTMGTTAIACRTEAFTVLGAVAWRTGRFEAFGRIVRCCRDLLRVCVARQVPAGGRDGVDARLNGAFLSGATPCHVRIDHVQHPLGGMFSYLQLVAPLVREGGDPAELDLGPSAGEAAAPPRARETSPDPEPSASLALS